MIMISSGAIYGPIPENVKYIHENQFFGSDPLIIDSAYGEGKRCMEFLGSVFDAKEYTNVNFARCFAFTGAGIPINGQFAFGNFIRDAIFSNTININGNPETKRSYLHAADLVIWLIKILLNGQPRQAYNVGSMKILTMLDLATKIRDKVSPNKKILQINFIIVK